MSTLAASNLKSDLDVSSAKVNLSEAQLLRLQAQNDVAAALANLSVVLGQSDAPSYVPRPQQTSRGQGGDAPGNFDFYVFTLSRREIARI